MGDKLHHARLAKEKRRAAVDELRKRRYSVVGDMAIKAVEQAIEAFAAIEDRHFHLTPRTAHAERIRWIKGRLPAISEDIDAVWGAYGMLGYGGVDGERAMRVIDGMERILHEISRKTHLRFR